MGAPRREQGPRRQRARRTDTGRRRQTRELGAGTARSRPCKTKKEGRREFGRTRTCACPRFTIQRGPPLGMLPVSPPLGSETSRGRLVPSPVFSVFSTSRVVKMDVSLLGSGEKKRKKKAKWYREWR